MNRESKARSLTVLKERLSAPGIVVLVHYSGLNVAEISDLRGRLKSQGGRLEVVKNRLARAALDGRGGEKASALFVGPVALASSAEVVDAPKIICAFASENEKLIVIGALLDNDVLNAADVKTLSAFPSMNELRARLLSLIGGPAGSLARLAAAPAAGLARLISLRAAGKGE